MTKSASVGAESQVSPGGINHKQGQANLGRENCSKSWCRLSTVNIHKDM